MSAPFPLYYHTRFMESLPSSLIELHIFMTNQTNAPRTEITRVVNLAASRHYLQQMWALPTHTGVGCSIVNDDDYADKANAAWQETMDELLGPEGSC
jgi:hypothetical protein